MSIISKTKTSRIEVVVFDFDGVFVLDSDAVFKKEAWDIAFIDYIGRYESFLSEANSRFGSGKKGGRTDIIKFVLERLNVPNKKMPLLVQEASIRFNDHVQKRILEAGLVPGVIDMLEKLIDENVQLYINSGTATPALLQSVRGLGVQHYFRGVFGSTPEPEGGSKVENLERISNKAVGVKSSMLFVGDSMYDATAAKIFGCDFVGIATKHNRWFYDKQEFDTVPSMESFIDYFESYYIE
jgi:phosphoglycolate phosphatase-like HAD superfamily hydrolase